MFKSYNDVVKDKDDASRELQRLKDAQKLRQDALQASGIAPGSAAKPKPKSPSGYQLWQLLLVIVIFMLIGAIFGKYERQILANLNLD